ncbi:hypothetical protein [Cognatishimia sp. MH4019]|uniref:hypothetical protein n=1 Tax=Cognatishimia sp. MH4019 TaxID=2854030 RepID=UPI001CD415BB|nr:hypothetical protein [Cognatishimia sp. MH4019]
MKCWACQSELAENQKFCCECEHWQNWRRYFGFSTTVLSLLVALISVLGVVTPILMDVINKIDVPVVEVSGSHSENYQAFSIQVENLSDKPVVFPSLLRCFEADPPEERSFAVYIYQASSSSFVRDGEGTVVDYVFSQSMHTSERNTIELPASAKLRCEGFFRRANGEKVVMRFTSKTLLNFWLERDSEQYYPGGL